MRQSHLAKPRLLGFKLDPALAGLLVVLVVFMTLRFVNLDRKVYWHDEVFTSLTLAGYTTSEAELALAARQEFSLPELQHYLQPNPDRWLRHSVAALATEDPQVTPLYFVLTRYWVKTFGASVAMTRAASALYSVLLLPALFWFCLELFSSVSVASLAVLLVAVSPFHLLYAQEAREYTLWGLVLCLLGAVFLRAFRLGTPTWWTLYGLVAALALYTHALSALVLVAQGLCVVGSLAGQWRGREGRWRSLSGFLLAGLLGIGLFAPWAAIIVRHLDLVTGHTSWSSQGQGPQASIQNWLLNVGHLFVDHEPSLGVWDLALAVGLALLVLYAVVYTARRAPRPAGLLLLALIVVPCLGLLLPDITAGGMRSLVGRYLMPAYLAMHLAVAYFIVEGSRAPGVRRSLGYGLGLVLVLGGALSCLSLTDPVVLHTKGASNYPSMAAVINQSPRPLVLTDRTQVNVYGPGALAALLRPDARLRLVSDIQAVVLQPGDDAVFILNPGPVMRQSIAARGDRLEPIVDGGISAGSLFRWVRGSGT